MSGWLSQTNSNDAWNFTGGVDNADVEGESQGSFSSVMARRATPLSYDKMSHHQLLVHIGELNVKLDNAQTECRFQEGRIKTINEHHEQHILRLRTELDEQRRVNINLDKVLYLQRSQLNQLQGNYDLDSPHHLLPTHRRDGNPINLEMRKKAQKTVRIVEKTVEPPPKKGFNMVGVSKKGAPIFELNPSSDDEDEVANGMADLRRLAEEGGRSKQHKK